MKRIMLYIFVLFSISGFSQETLKELLKMHNTRSVPYISVNELAMPGTEVILLDSREETEYNISHLKNAICVGYDHFDIDAITEKIPNKDSKIVVYCSLGIRSEDVGELLKKAGYNNIYNLYGGIFEWKNNDFPVYNSENEETEDIHTFSEEWSHWLTKGNKVYD